MDHKSQWTNEVLKSAEGIKRATPSDALFDQISKQLPNSDKTKFISVKKLSWAAAAACILILVNIVSISLPSDSAAIDNNPPLYEIPIFNRYELDL